MIVNDLLARLVIAAGTRVMVLDSCTLTSFHSVSPLEKLLQVIVFCSTQMDQALV